MKKMCSAPHFGAASQASSVINDDDAAIAAGQHQAQKHGHIGATDPQSIDQGAFASG